MDASRRRSIRRRRAGRTARAIPRCALAGALLGGALLTGGTAFAQIGDHLLPPLDEVIEPVESILPLPSKSPIEELTDPLEEILEETEGTIGDTIDPLLGGDDAGDGDSGGQGDPGGTGSGGGSDGSGGSGDGDGGGSGDGSTGGEEAGTDDPFGSLLPGGGANGSATLLAPGGYAGIAARATVGVIERAVRLAGPLAPPLLLAVVATLGLLALGRGSDKLLKTEATRAPARTYRL